MDKNKERTEEEIIKEGASRLAEIFVDLIDEKEKDNNKDSKGRDN